MYICTSLSSHVQCPQKLKYLYLRGSKKLARLPNLRSAANLEQICLMGCERLREIPSSIRFLHKLDYLNLYGCKKLRSLPSLFQLKNLRHLSLSFCINLKQISEIPSVIEQLDLLECGMEEWSTAIQSLDNLEYLPISMCKNLRSLPRTLHFNLVEELDLSGCSNLNKFPNVTGHLKKLVLEETPIEELPSTIGCLPSLVDLQLGKCYKLESLPDSICELKCLERLLLWGCSKLDRLPPLYGLCSLTDLYLDGTAVSEIPSDIVSLSSLRLLSLNNCKRLQNLPELPEQTRVLRAFGCASLQTAKSPLSFARLQTPNDWRWGNKYLFNYCNCLNLDHETLGSIMANARLRIEEMAIASNMSVLPEVSGGFLVGFPRKFEVPLAMNKDDMLLLTCRCRLKNADGNERLLPFVAPEIRHDSMHLDSVIQADHVFLWHNHYYIESCLIQKYSDVNELSIEFEFKAEHYGYTVGDAMQLNVVKLKVKRCGVHLMYTSKDEEYQCSPSIIQTKHSLHYAATDSDFMQEVIGTADTSKKRSSNQANIIADGRSDKRMKEF
ncbi:hypothetical protein GH714_018343 [Hevea brasiliensis]|uniref:Uncharacterized protein n=1 Tax=Hevea brasiliensis TaxID=3981 RepID=A0A6A6L6Y6_HEVBR|nr:hypothetical protein GH714_018343 [Hevea brasiliensis]